MRAAKDLEKKKETLEKMRLEKEKKELEEVTFAPHIPESSAQITKRRSVHGGDGEKEDIFSRLAAEQTHNLDKTIEMGDIYDKKPALPEKALDQVFRRLSTTPIRTHSVSDMSYYSGDVPDDRSIMTRSTMRSTDSRRSIVLAETDLDQLFNRLSVPATKGADGQPDESGQSRRKSMSAKDVANVVRRLSVNKGSPSETFSEINPMASPSPTRSASVPKAMSHTRSSEKVRSVSRKPSGIAGIQEDLEEESPKATPTARDSNKEPAKRSPSLGYSSSSVRKMFPDAQEEVTSPFKPPAGKDTNGKATVLTNTVFNIKNSDNNRVVVPRKPKNTREDPDSATSNTIISSAASNSPEEEQTSTEVDQRGEMLRNKQNHMHTSSPNPLMNRRGSAVVSPSLPPNIPIPPPQILEEKKKPLAIPVAGTPKQSVAERIAALNKKKAVGAAAAGPIELSSEPKVLRGKKKKTTDSNSVSASDAASSSNAENIEALQGAMQDKVAEESASNNGKSIESGTNSLNESGEEENNIEKEPHDHHFNSIDDEFDVVDNADQ